MPRPAPTSLLYSSRFYIIAGSLLLSGAGLAWLRLRIQSDQLYYIRAQELAGLASVAYWYVALIISPLSNLVGEHRLKYLLFARRAIGVSAAYFALLHTGLAVSGQLGGWDALSRLPRLYDWSLAAGAVALLILLVLAATSFDKVIAFMTFPHWKRLQRLVYVGGVLALFHIMSVGAHVSYPGVRVTAGVALVGLGGLEILRLRSAKRGRRHA